MNTSHIILIFFIQAFTFCFPIIMIAGEFEPYFLKKKYCLYLFLLYIFLNFFDGVNLHSRLYDVITFYYFIFHIPLKKTHKISTFYAVYLALAYESIHFILVSIFYRAFPPTTIEISFLGQTLGIFFTEGLYMLLSLFALFIVLFILRYLKLDKDLLESPYFTKIINFAYLPFYLLSSIFIITYTLIRKKNPLICEFDIVISLFIFIGFLLTLLYIYGKQIELSHKIDIEQREQENQNLHQLVVELGTLYDEIRGFRHDFGGIVACLEPAIEQENIKEIKQIYENVLLKMNKRLTRNDYTMFSFKRIEDIALKNVLAQKILQAKSLHIPFYLEVITDIPIIEIPMLDTVRLLTILLDNALEETQQTNNPYISVALVHEHHHTTVIIQNTRQQNKIDTRKIWEQGYSTKGENHGNGLPILLNIIHTLENVEIETRIDKKTFTQTLIFRKKGAYL